jgi:CHAD domain-containing protein
MKPAASKFHHFSPAALKRTAARLVGNLVDELKRSNSTSGVHGVRRRIKQLRSLVHLLRANIGEPAYQLVQQHLKSAADALAGQRRAEALVAAASKFGQHGKRDATAHLVRLTEHHRDAHSSNGIPAEQLAAARRAVAAAQKSVSAWKLPKCSDPQIAAAFFHYYRKGRKKLAGAMKSGKPEQLHEARKQVIHHLHHLDLLQSSLAADPTKRIAALENLREILGDLNDLDEIEQLAASESADVRGDVAPLLRKRRKALLRRAEKAWEPLFKWKGKAFAKRIGAMWGETAP